MTDDEQADADADPAEVEFGFTVDQEPNHNPDFEGMGIGPETAETLETVWTLLLRGYESPKFPEITGETVFPLLYDVYLHPEGGPLTADEAQDLEVWIDALGDARPPDRAFTDLTCLEYSALSVLTRALERSMTETVEREVARQEREKEKGGEP